MIAVDQNVRRITDGLTRARQRWRRFDHAVRAYDRFEDVMGSRLAAAIAYYGFFAVFALAMLAYAGLGFLLEHNEAVSGAVRQYLALNLPWLDPDTIQGSRTRVGVIGVVGLVITGVGWIEAIRSSQRLVHGVEQQPGNVVVRKAVDLVILLALLGLLGTSLMVAYALEALIQWLTGGPSLGLTVVGWLLTVVVNVVLAGALLGGVPRLRLPVRLLVPTVVFVALGITVLNTLGRFLIDRIQDNPAYTVMASAVGLLVYLYVINHLLLLGAAWMATSRPRPSEGWHTTTRGS